MLQSEFIDRTGFYPTIKEWSRIEMLYNASDLHKDEWCKWWKKNELSHASARAQRAVNDMERQLANVNDIHLKDIQNITKEHQETLDARDKEIEALKRELTAYRLAVGSAIHKLSNIY